MSQNNNKNGLFRPWDEENELSGDGEGPGHLNFVQVHVKCEREAEEDEGFDDPGSTSSPAHSAAGSSSRDAEEEDSLNKLTSLVDRTILGLPATEHSYDGSSGSEVSFPSSSPCEDSPRSAFVPTQGYVSSYPPVVRYANVSSCFDGGTLMRQEVAGRQEPVTFEHFRAAQQGHFAIEEAARLLQHHEALIKQSKKLRPKKFRCPHCDVAFSNNGQLKGHVRIHTGERPFKCDEEGCGKTFTRNEELTRHKRIHSGVRPHACPACGKRFGRKDHLKKHARTHEMRGPTIYIPAPGPFPFPAHPPIHPFLFGL